MNIKNNIKRILLLALWIVTGCGVMVLLIAAIDTKSRKECAGTVIEISGAKKYFFLTRQDISRIISREGEDEPKGKMIAEFNLQRLETLLEQNVWVKDAELFFDNNFVLHVSIVEKEPVARIFTTNGYSFYIDSSGDRMPLSDKVSVRLPVFTGFPVEKNVLKGTDSLLVEDIKKISSEIVVNPFWMAQIEQVSILPDRNFEMIPTIGNHLIQFGNGDNCANKFRRLYIFYSQVLSVAGFDKYSRVSVQFDNQIIGTKKGIPGKVDSVQALKNIQKMIEDSRRVYEDSDYIPPVNLSKVIKNDSLVSGRFSDNEDSLNPSLPVNQPAAKKIVTSSKIIDSKKKADVKTKTKTIPKAVMKKL